jgi:hypothetical protein
MRYPMFPRCFWLAAFMLSTAAAQAGESAPGMTPIERVLSAEVRDEIGKQYWVRGGTATNQVFCNADQFPRLDCEGAKFGPRDSERFTIEAVNIERPASRADAWFRIRFESGKTGYLNADTLRSQVFVEMRHQNAQTDSLPAVYELFFTEQPEIIISRMHLRMHERQANAARREQERFDRGAVHVGMTKQQVLNSSWGQPDRVHASIAGWRRREQWVYGAANLYFDDGILTAVQTAR